MSALLSVLSVAPSAFVDGVDVAEPQAATLEQLRRDVERWGEAALLDATAEDYDDVTGWLNRNFYRFGS